MNGAREVIAEAARCGVELFATPDGNIRFRHRGAAPDHLLRALRRWKAEVLALLAGAPEPWDRATALSLMMGLDDRLAAMVPREHARRPDLMATAERVCAAWACQDLAGVREGVAAAERVALAIVGEGAGRAVPPPGGCAGAAGPADRAAPLYDRLRSLGARFVRDRGGRVNVEGLANPLSAEAAAAVLEHEEGILALLAAEEEKARESEAIRAEMAAPSGDAGRGPGRETAGGTVGHVVGQTGLTVR